MGIIGNLNIFFGSTFQPMIRLQDSTFIHREKQTVRLMVGLYCKKKHKINNALCSECEDLLTYSLERLDRCRFGNNKLACSKCPVHCFQASYREMIRKLMRFSGPRMLFYDPLHVINHYLPLKRLDKTH
jgi:hypothetical protein